MKIGLYSITSQRAAGQLPGSIKIEVWTGGHENH
jgi:hypothetical protein